MKSMRFRLWAGMMALIVIVLILLWFFQIVFLGSFYTGMQISNVKKEAERILESRQDIGRTEMENKLNALAFQYNMSVEMIDSEGSTVFSAGSTGMGGQMPMMMNSSRVAVYQQAMTGKAVEVPLIHPRFGNRFMMIGLPVKATGSVTGVLILNLPLAPVEETASILKWQLLYITGILLIASLLISFLISKSFTRPILNIKKAAETMASGDFSVRIPSGKQDEIGKLAGTVNYMGEQLSKIDQLRKDLIANISHELRTPLSLIRGYAETIRDVTGNSPEKRDKQLDIIIDETERLSRIVDDILNLSQLQSGYARLEKSRFSMRETLDAIVKRYHVLSEKTGVKIVLQCPEDVILEADRAKLEQVFYNLINNAFQHTPAGGMITVSAAAGETAVRFEISDTGSGIPEEDLPHIWERFYKADKTGSQKAAGTGLGLAIAKGVLEAHRADFGVRSKQGMGTTFWFELKK
ncbi:MAG TPA: ATP-binding protein [Clostridia bacterium]|nr:ATP-binding protein [Clostridia bacterium]